MATTSLPKDVKRLTARLARARGTTEAQVLRAAVRRLGRDDATWRSLLAYGRRKAAAAGLRSERDVERLVDAHRS